MSNSQTCGHCGKSYDDGTGTTDGNCSDACDVASEQEAMFEYEVRAHIAEVIAEERKRLRVALRRVAEDEKRSERERELLLDLVEALGGEAAT